MAWPKPRRPRAALLAVLTVIVGGLAACSLGLTGPLPPLDGGTSGDADGGRRDGESDPGDGGGDGTSPGGDGSVGGDGGNRNDGGDGGPRLVESCLSDFDCSVDGCLRGRCDPLLGRCDYLQCRDPAAACQVSACQGNTCGGANATYGFRSRSFAVAGTLGCSLTAARCVAAVHPFLVVGTTTGPTVFDVSDVTSTAPRSVPVSGLTFVPTQILASGRRVYFFGDLVGAAAPFQLPIAVADVPTDPRVTTLEVQATTIAYPYPTYDAIGFASGSNVGKVAIVYNDAVTEHPVGLVAPPLTAGGTMALAPAPPGTRYVMNTSPGVPAGQNFAASSGDRLVALLVSPEFTTNLKAEASLQTNPGTALSTNLGRVQQSQGAVFFVEHGTGTDGTLLMTVGYTYQMTLRWLLPNAQSTQLTYSGPTVAYLTTNDSQYTPRHGPVAWLDRDRVLALGESVPPGTNGTAVRVATRATNPASLLPRSQNLSVNLRTDPIAAVSAAGKGYVVSASASGSSLRVDAFDPDCP